jgi:ribonuclease HI
MMAFKFEDELRERAERFIAVLNEAGIEATIVPASFRDYMVKVSVSRAGRVFGHVNLYYSPKKDLFSLRTHELRDKAIVPDLQACWDCPIAPAPAQTVYQIYVDGSCIDENVGYGLVVLKDGQIIDELYGPVEDDAAQGMRQVAGELQAAQEAIAWCQEHGTAEVSLFYDYEGIEKWAIGVWHAKKPATQAYAQAAQEWPVVVYWHKVDSHTGNRWNDRADELAKQGARVDAIEPEVDSMQDPLEALGAKLEEFVLFLKDRGVDSAYQGICNNQFFRIAVAPGGYMDIYNTRKRSPSQPYLHSFRDKALQGVVKDLWQEYYEGRSQESDCEKAWLEDATYYYEILKPYRDCAFDFWELASALERAYCHLQQIGIDVKSNRYDFDKLEVIYCALKEETEIS